MHHRQWIYITALAALLGAMSGCKSKDETNYPLLLNGRSLFYTKIYYWNLTEGTANVVSTWHGDDTGYELVGNPTILSTSRMPIEMMPPFGSIKFLTDGTDDDTKIEIYIDYFEKDYQVEGMPVEPYSLYDAERYHTEYDLGRYPTDRKAVSVDVKNWKLFTYYFDPPQWADYMAVHLVKKGEGRVVLSLVLLDAIDNGPIDTEQSEIDEYLYEPCKEDADCGADGICAPYFSIGEEDESRVCSYCATDADCDGISICGIRSRWNVWSGAIRDCVAPNAKPLKELCAVDGECADGICCAGVCSLCCDDKDCEGDGTCTREWEDDPFQCDPGKGLYEDGARCFRNEDCKSGLCDGEVSEASQSEDCTDGGVEESDAGASCPADGVLYGSCAEK